MAVETAPPGWMQDWSAQGSGKNARVGVLLVHGFTGAPPSMRPWGEFLHSKGYTVRVPLLPGHGTKPEDLNKVKWQEWPAKVQSELDELFKSCDQVFVAGLSMGGGRISPTSLDGRGKPRWAQERPKAYWPGRARRISVRIATRARFMS